MGNKTRDTGNLVSENNIFVDISNDRVGIGSTQPTSKLNVVGTVSATSFTGDGSALTGVGGTVAISDNAPSSPNVGDLWWESDTASGFIYYNDGNSSQWVEFNPTGSAGPANATISDNAPNSPTHGDLWWESDTATGHIYYNDGNSAQWVQFNSGSGGGASGISSVGIQSGGVLVGSASTINFVTTGSVSVSNDIATVSVGSSIRFVGARIYHDNFTPAGINATYEVQNWDGTSIDTHSFVDSSNGFTIPAGVSKVRMTIGARASTGSVANQWFIFKNGSILDTINGGIFVESEANSGYNNGSVTGVTGVISVTEGDTFDLRYYLNSTTPTWDIFFEIEVIEGDILGNYFAGSSATSRFTASNTTGSIGAGTTADITIAGAKAYSLFKIDTSHAAWVRLYTDTNSRTNDASRAYTTDPTPGSGVLAEVYTTTSGSNTFKMTPAVIGWNDDSTPTTNIYAKVTNNESTSQDITVTLTILRMED